MFFKDFVTGNKQLPKAVCKLVIEVNDMRQLEQAMAHSDTEDVYEPGEAGILDSLLENEAYEKNIHSGHFMVSHVHEATEKNILDHAGSEHSTESRDSFTYGDDLNESSKATTIDPSLTKLFKCMSIVENTNRSDCGF